MDPTQPDPKSFMRHILRLGSGLLALCALLDVSREALTAGAWRASALLGGVYGWTVCAYSGTRSWEKWLSPEAQESYGGHWYMHAWFILPVTLWAAGLTGLAQPSFPPGIFDAYRYILAAFTGAKAIGRYSAAKKGDIPPLDQALTPDQAAARHALRIGSHLLGLVCLADAALEMFTLGEWHFAPGLYQCYAMTLAAYAATRQWEKWTDPLDQDAHWGGWFVAAWLLLAATCWILQFFGFMVLWPENLSFAIGTVLAVYAGSKISVSLRDANIKEGWGAAPRPLPQAPDPVQAGEAAGTTKPVEQSKQDQPAKKEEDKREPEPEAGEPKAHKRPVSRENVNPRAAATAKALDHFQVADFTAKMPCESDEAAHGFIGVLVRAGLVHNEGHGWYKWIGD